MRSRWCEGMYSSIYVIELRGRFVAMGEDICQKQMLVDRGNHGTGQVSMSRSRSIKHRLRGFPLPCCW